MRLILVRHGETAWNRDGRFQGQSLIELNHRGITQARHAARALHAMRPPVALYSSPLPRTMMTSQEISNELSLPIVPIEGLKEINLGELEGITGQEMRSQHADIWAAWREDPSDVVFPGGESIRQLQERSWTSVTDLEKAHPDGVIAVVSHNFAIRSILCRFLGMPLSRFHLLRVDLGSLSTVHSNSRSRQVVAINDKCHLNRVNG